MSSGVALIEYAGKNDLESFKRVYKSLGEDQQLSGLIYWHEHRAFKEAVKYKALLILQHLIHECGLDLQQDCFK